MNRPRVALAGAGLLAFILGSVHAFSILLLALESEFGVSRSTASLTYSIALAALAAAVLLGHRLYDRLSPPAYVAMTGALAAAGCTLAAFSPSMVFVWLGFGLVFGAANGLGYGYALQFAGRALPQRRGFAMGFVTACYALGAVVFPVPLRFAIAGGGWAAALLLLAVCLLITAALSALTLAASRVTYALETENTQPVGGSLRQQTIWLWLSYCGAVTAGLMAIGHATGMVAASDGGTFWITLAPIVIALANMVGSLLAGTLTDWFGGRSVLTGLAALTATALLLMAVAPQLTVTLIGLSVVGFAYGGTIAAYPAYISHRFSTGLGTVVYGRVFTAWAAAGLMGPAAAGLFFDLYQNYLLALGLAALSAVISLVIFQTKAQGETKGYCRNTPV
ncbi:MFS transporter [Pontibaca salina]|uniref:MFS transporter n=1 Tax=Pontibaca salina TaxID=2795731 RepID=A0A934M424_9RHOB|nr:MFS transporter [Pontibaca salina]MBI6630449.1 MFS transporter [Pontibaca salina]